MRLWRKRESVEEAEPEQGDEAPAAEDVVSEADDPAAEAPPVAEVTAATDSALPGTAGYRHRKKGDVMPGRFTFVRPDGQPEPRRRRGWLRG